MHIRPATRTDVPVILRFIRDLAEYERELDAVVATEVDLLRDGFGLAGDGVTKLAGERAPHFTALMAEVENEPAGFALYFRSYSTWRGHHGIRLEDLYVTPAMRGKGIGKALLARLARIAVDEGCSRLEWDVLAWNQSAIDVYEAVGARTQTEWRIMRLTGEPLAALSERGSV